MKKDLELSTDYSIEISFEKCLLTPETLQEFSRLIRKADSIDDLFEFAAEQLCCKRVPHFIEGLGYAALMGTTLPGPEGVDAPIKFRITYESTEVFGS